MNETPAEYPFPSEDCQVVHGTFFSHNSRPCLTLRPWELYVNAACLRKLPDVDYIQLLIHQTEKKLALRPCREDTKDSVRWCGTSPKRSPRHIPCPVFFWKITSLMDWNPGFRYRLTGRLLSANEEQLFVFDLTEPEVFPVSAKAAQSSSPQVPIYPEEWKTRFGIPLPDHRNTPQIRIFHQYTVFQPEPLSKYSPKPISETDSVQKGGVIP